MSNDTDDFFSTEHCCQFIGCNLVRTAIVELQQPGGSKNYNICVSHAVMLEALEDVDLIAGLVMTLTDPEVAAANLAEFYKSSAADIEERFVEYEEASGDGF